LESVQITDTGDALLITGPTRETVDAAFQALLSQGSKAISAASPLGRKWLASCTKPRPSPAIAETLSAAVAEQSRRSAPSAVTISDAGPYLLVSGDDREAVRAALGELAKTGADATLDIAHVGNKWIGRCENVKFGLREVKIEQYGLSYVLSGRNREAVQSKLQEFVAKGAIVLVEIQEIEGQWVATCDTGGGHDDVHKW
jgi:hypothetical protein